MIRTTRFRNALAVALAAGGGLLAVMPATPAGAALPPKNSAQIVCSDPQPGELRCFAQVRTDGAPGLGVQLDAPAGYGPADLQSAYRLPVTAGAGRTVAIIASGDAPVMESDLLTYRQQFGLPECSTLNGCFSKINQRGAASPLPAADVEGATESTLDVEMVSAACPLCHILVVEANSAFSSDLFAAMDTAAARAQYVSFSFGVSEFDGEKSYDVHFNHPGVVITVASGDSGAGTDYPAASPFVTAVGGTTLLPAQNARGWDETAWPGAGSGCSAYETKPSWEAPQVSGCNAGARLVADVSAVADVDNSPLAMYDTFGWPGWIRAGGTSAAAPIIAAAYALAGVPAPSEYPASYPHLHAGRQQNDVTAGSNGNCGAPLCTAGPGWDGPTGRGTPNGVGGLSNFTVQRPSDVTIFLGQSISATLTASGGTAPYAFLVSPLPPGLSYDPATRVISGTPTFTGTVGIGVRATEALGVASQAIFNVTVIDRVTVPEVEGLSLSVADSRLHQAGLSQVHGSVTSCEGPPGTVISQTPDGGTVVPVGTTVTLTLAKAPVHGCA